jgi:hypothetical protein
VSKAIMVAQFLRARGWWRLDSAGRSALHVARSVVSLLDAAAYAEGLPDDDPVLAALDAAGCFTGGLFNPGPEGWMIVRDWQLADEATEGPEDLLDQLARAAGRQGPDTQLAWSRPLRAGTPGTAGTPLSIPRQPGPASEPVSTL